MIFSENNCPLCGTKLECKIVKLSTTPAEKISFFYSCRKTEIVRNASNSADVIVTHYTNEVFQTANKDSLAEMIIPPYVIYHSSYNKLTSVYHFDVAKRKPKKLIFRAPLLDIDYSQPHIVMAKLKVLVTFS